MQFFNYLIEPRFKTGIYAIRNDIDARPYVGSAKNLRKRYNEHKQDLEKGEHHSQRLQNFVSKYTDIALFFELLEECSPEELVMTEQKWIDLFDSHDRNKGFNICPYAGSSLGVKRTEEYFKNRMEPKGKDHHRWGKTFQGVERPDVRKAILQIDDEGNKIAEFESVTEAAEKLNLFASMIAKVCRGEQITTKGFKFCFRDEAVSAKTPVKRPKIIVKKNDETVFIGSAKEVAEFFEIPHGRVRNIVCNGKYRNHSISKEQTSEDNVFIPCSKPKPVLQVGPNDETLAEFSSAAEAARVLGISPCAVGQMCNGKSYSQSGVRFKFKNSEDRKPPKKTVQMAELYKNGERVFSGTIKETADFIGMSSVGVDHIRKGGYNYTGYQIEWVKY